MSALNDLENSLEKVFVKNAPKLPEKAKETIVEWLPWINLVLGILTLWSAYVLWHWAHLANGLANYVNQLSQTYGINTPAAHRLGAVVWLGLIVLAVEGILYIMAFQATRARAKNGWNLLFYALLVNLVYGFVNIFSNYGGFGSFIGYLIGTAVGLYFLFQIRSRYLGTKSAPSEHQA